MADRSVSHSWLQGIHPNNRVKVLEESGYSSWEAFRITMESIGCPLDEEDTQSTPEADSVMDFPL